MAHMRSMGPATETRTPNLGIWDLDLGIWDLPLASLRASPLAINLDPHLDRRRRGVRIFLPERRHRAACSRHDLHPPDSHDRRAAAVRDAGRRHRRAWQPETGRQD